MSPEQQLAEFAAAHHGLARTSVFLDAGGTKSGLRHLIDSGRWIRLTRRVVRAAGAPVTDRQRALAAVLDAEPDAVLTNGSAAALWGVGGFALLPPAVLRPRIENRRPLTLGKSYWATIIPAELVTVLDGIPVVRPSYLALLLFGSVHPARAQRAASTLLSKRLATLDGLERVLDLLAVQGRDGIVRLREFVEEERRRGGHFDSGLERRFDWILTSHGQKRMRCQVEVGDTDGWIGRVDFLDEDVPLVVEIDSDLHHGALADVEADARRTAALEAAGYTVKRFTEDDLWFRPEHVVAEVRRLRRELNALRRAA